MTFRVTTTEESRRKYAGVYNVAVTFSIRGSDIEIEIAPRTPGLHPTVQWVLDTDDELEQFVQLGETARKVLHARGV